MKETTDWILQGVSVVPGRISPAVASNGALIHSHVEAPEKPDTDSAPVAARSRARICIYLGVCMGEGGVL
jgi:hypothetical protein